MNLSRLKSFRILNRNEGFSLIEVMISFGLMSILAAALLTLVSKQQRQIKFSEQKYEALDLTYTLQRTFSDTVLCSNQLTGLMLVPAGTSFAPKNITNINSTDIAHPLVRGPVAAVSSPLPGSHTGLTVESIKLKDFLFIGGNVYKSTLEVKFDPSSSIIPLRPVEISIMAQVNPVTHTVLGCESASGLTKTELKNMYYHKDLFFPHNPALASETRFLSCDPGDVALNCTWMPRYMGVASPRRVTSWYLTTVASPNYSFTSTIIESTATCQFAVTYSAANIATWPSTDLRINCLDVN